MTRKGETGHELLAIVAFPQKNQSINQLLRASLHKQSLNVFVPQQEGIETFKEIQREKLDWRRGLVWIGLDSYGLDWIGLE